MSHFANLKAVAAAAGACAALFASAPAAAYVYATSHLEVTNLAIITTPGLMIPLNYSFDATNKAAMNNPGVSSGASCDNFSTFCSLVSPVLDAAVVNAAGSTMLRANNNFAFLGTSFADSYSNADSVINTAALVQGIPTSINQIAESLLSVNGFATANSEQQSNTSLRNTFSLGPAFGATDLDLSFMADPDMRSQINGAPGSYLSQANMNVSFTLSNSNGDSVNWSPKGTAANDCVVSGAWFGLVTCMETADTQNLNRNTSAAANPSTSDNSFEAGQVLTAFGIHIAGLTADTYTLALNAVTSTTIRRNVIPEPDALALVGIAMAGLAFTARRRGRKQV